MYCGGSGQNWFGGIIWDGCIKAKFVKFEPTRGDPIGLAGRRLGHSAKVSMCEEGAGIGLRSRGSGII